MLVTEYQAITKLRTEQGQLLDARNTAEVALAGAVEAAVERLFAVWEAADNAYTANEAKVRHILQDLHGSVVARRVRAANAAYLGEAARLNAQVRQGKR